MESILQGLLKGFLKECKKLNYCQRVKYYYVCSVNLIMQFFCNLLGQEIIQKTDSCMFLKSNFTTLLSIRRVIFWVKLILCQPVTLILNHPITYEVYHLYCMPILIMYQYHINVSEGLTYIILKWILGCQIFSKKDLLN